MRSAFSRQGALTVRQKLSALLRTDNLTVADYDASLGVTGDLAVSSWANQIGAAPALTQGTGANQPIHLPFAGQKYGYIPNANSNTFTAPDDAALNPVATISIRMDVAFDDETKGSWANHSGAAGNGGWTVDGGGAGGKLRFGYTNDGTTFRTATASVVPTVSAGQRLSYRYDYNVSTGKVDFYTAPDFTTWAALGVQQSLTAGTIFDTTAVLRFGNRNGNDDPAYGKWYRFQVWIDGVLVKDWNATDWPETSTNGATQASSTTGETWTLNNTGTKPAQIVGSASLLFDGAAQYLKTGAFTLNQPISYYLVIKQISWTFAEAILDGQTLNSGSIGQFDVTPKLNLYSGAGGVMNGELAVGAWGTVQAVLNGASSSVGVNSGAAVTGNAGIGNPGGLIVGASAPALPAGFSNVQVKRVILRAAADSAGTQAQIQGLLRSIYGTP